MTYVSCSDWGEARESYDTFLHTLLESVPECVTTTSEPNLLVGVTLWDEDPEEEMFMFNIWQYEPVAAKAGMMIVPCGDFIDDLAFEFIEFMFR